MARPDTVTGTITLVSGQVAFTTSGVQLQTRGHLRGDTIHRNGLVLIIDEITGENSGTLLDPCPAGAAGSAVPVRIRFQADGSRIAAQTRNLMDLLGNESLQSFAGLNGAGGNLVPMFTGPDTLTLVPKTDLVAGVDYDVQVNALADRAAYNTRPAGFAVLVSNVGDGRSAVYSKNTATSGDWSAAAYVTGPVGPVGVIGTPRGPWATATAYAARDLVERDGSTYIAKTAHTSGVWATDLLTKWDLVVSKGASGNITAPQGRLSLVSGVAVPTSDNVGATAIYYMPFAGNLISIWDGTAFQSYEFSQLTLNLDADAGHSGFHVAGHIYDLWVFRDGSTLRLGTTEPWATGGGSDTARGSVTALELKNGIWTNASPIYIRYGNGAGDRTVAPVTANRATYVGSFVATLIGQATDSLDRRLLCNAYNPVERPVRRTDPATFTAYSLNAAQVANGNANNYVEVLSGLGGSMVDLTLGALVSNNDSTRRQVSVVIGPTATTQFSECLRPRKSIDQFQDYLTAHYKGAAGIGRRKYYWQEQGAGAGTQTWYYNGVWPGVGLIGSVVI